jgi:hypothetical protein
MICKKCGGDMHSKKESFEINNTNSGMPILFCCKDCEYSEYLEYEYFL